MGNESEINFIGNVRFEGVKVLKSEVKKTSQGDMNCVWTDAGYFEYKNQPLMLLDGLARIHSEVKKIKFPDCGENVNSLFIKGMIDGSFDLQSDQYVGVSHNGDEDRDYSSFTISTKNGKQEAVSRYNSNANLITDENDYVTERKSPWGGAKNNKYIEHTPINQRSIEYK